MLATRHLPLQIHFLSFSSCSAPQCTVGVGCISGVSCLLVLDWVQPMAGSERKVGVWNIKLQRIACARLKSLALILYLVGDTEGS